MPILSLKTFEKYRGSVNPHKKAMSLTLEKPCPINVQACCILIMEIYFYIPSLKYFL